MSDQGTAGASSPRLSGQQYRELFEESHDAILITERDGVILDANHAASEFFAWPHTDFIGMNVRRIYANAEDRARFQEQIEREGDCEVPDRDLRVSVYRCIRELLLNVTRHAGTDAAGVSLRREGAELRVVVEDSGRGFDPLHPEGIRHRFGFGLFSIRECMTQAGGSFHIESTPGQGTRCQLTVPGQERKGGSP